MVEITPKQRSFLRGLGQRLEPIISVGKGGCSDALVRTVGAMLDDHELVKVRLPGGLGAARWPAAEEIAAATGAAFVGVVGRNMLLYRPSEKLAEDKRIHLPAE